MDATRFLDSLKRAEGELQIAAHITPAFPGDTAPRRVASALGTITTLIETVQAEELDRRYPSTAAVAAIPHVRSAR